MKKQSKAAVELLDAPDSSSSDTSEIDIKQHLQQPKPAPAFESSQEEWSEGGEDEMDGEGGESELSEIDCNAKH